MIKNKVIANASWIIACKIVQAVLALVINMLTARYLGPSQFGILNYAASLVSFVTPLMQLGINSILVQELVNYPKKDGEILGTSITMNVVSAFLCILGVFSFSSVANAGEHHTILVCSLYSVVLIFQAVEMVQYWFQAKLLSKYTSLTMLVAYLIVSGYRIFLLVTNKNIYWFSITSAFDCMLIAGTLVFFYYKLGGNRFSFSFYMAKRLLKKGRCFIVSSLMITIFSQTDKVMLMFSPFSANITEPFTDRDFSTLTLSLPQLTRLPKTLLKKPPQQTPKPLFPEKRPPALFSFPPTNAFPLKKSPLPTINRR